MLNSFLDVQGVINSHIQISKLSAMYNEGTSLGMTVVSQVYISPYDTKWYIHQMMAINSPFFCWLY